jgi:hypothetical protein
LSASDSIIPESRCYRSDLFAGQLLNELIYNNN